MTKISILKQGDRVINITDHTIAIEHANGEVTLYHYTFNFTSGKIQIHGDISLCFEEYEKGCDELAGEDITEDKIDIVHF